MKLVKIVTMAATPTAAAAAAATEAVPGTVPIAPVPFVLRAAAPKSTKSRKRTSTIWDFVFPLAEPHDKLTHVCVFRDANGECNTELTMYRSGTIAWSTSMAILHFKAAHPNSDIAQASVVLAKASSDHMSMSMDAAAEGRQGSSACASGSVFTMSPEDLQRSACARLYIYVPGCISKATF